MLFQQIWIRQVDFFGFWNNQKNIITFKGLIYFIVEQETLSCDIIDGIFRRDLSLVYHPFQSNLREVELSFKASK